MRPSGHGFTLIELLVALALLGVASAVALPLASESLQMYRLAASTRTIAFEISRARMQATAQSRWVRVRVESGSNEVQVCRQVSTNNGTTWSPSNCSSVSDRISLHAGTTVNANPAFPAFNERGLLQSTAPVTVTVSNSVGSKNIVTNLVGRVEIQ